MNCQIKYLSLDQRGDGLRKLLLTYLQRHPSFDTESDKWTEMFDCHIHRPTYGIHVSLLSPIIGRYFDNIRDHNFCISKIDTAATIDLCRATSLSTIKKDQRCQMLKECLCDYLEIPKNSIKSTEFRSSEYDVHDYEDGGIEVPIPSFCTAEAGKGKEFSSTQEAVRKTFLGNSTTINESEPCLAMYLSLEVRSELVGNDVVGMRTLGNYMDSLAKNLAASCNSPSPCLLLTMAGPHLNIDVAAFTIGTVVDPAVSFTPMLVSPLDQPGMVRLAQKLRATKVCLHELDAYYRNEITEVPQSEQIQLAYPYMRHFVCTYLGQTITVHFRYESPLESTKLVFLVKVTRVEHTLSAEQYGHFPLQVGARMVLKYTRTYCAAAHVHCFNYHKGAPELYGTGALPGGWMYMCMEYIDRMSWLQLMYRRDAKEALRELVVHLHSANYVHGDIQQANALVVDAPDRPRVCLVDFDWAGVEGVAKYPAFITPDVSLPDGVEDLMPILKEHDMHAVNTGFWNHL